MYFIITCSTNLAPKNCVLLWWATSDMAGRDCVSLFNIASLVLHWFYITFEQVETQRCTIQWENIYAVAANASNRALPTAPLQCISKHWVWREKVKTTRRKSALNLTLKFVWGRLNTICLQDSSLQTRKQTRNIKLLYAPCASLPCQCVVALFEPAPYPAHDELWQTAWRPIYTAKLKSGAQPRENTET